MTNICSSAGCQEQILEQQVAEDQPPPTAEERCRQKHGGSFARLLRLRFIFSRSTLIFFFLFNFNKMCVLDNFV